MNGNPMHKLASLLVVIGGLLSFTKHKKLAMGTIGAGILGLLYQFIANKKLRQ
jgi:hypothetical protein